jgi:murein DD-endopeptidase MepM/ murein hydrolase activator NlpD
LLAVFTQSGIVVGTHDQSRFIWPTVGRITQPYGCTGFSWEPRYGDCKHFHGGIDIANSRGTPIRAAGGGVITHVGWDPWGTENWMVILRHGNGLVTWYAHMRPKKIAGISEGVRVRQGQLVGYMSDTGHATGVHLHWAVLLDGRYTNPRHYVDGSPRNRDTANEPQSPSVGCTGNPLAFNDGPSAAVLLSNDPGGSPTSCSA